MGHSFKLLEIVHNPCCLKNPLGETIVDERLVRCTYIKIIKLINQHEPEAKGPYRSTDQ